MAKAGEGAAAAAEASSAPVAGGDVIARVGDQTITFGEISTILNSSAVVGVSVPAVGTPERDTVRVTILDKLISANLTYLDAKAKGVDKDPEYLRDVERFEKGILAGLYRQREMAGDIPVSDEEVQAYLDKHIDAGADVSDQMRLGVEARLRREKLKTRLKEAHAALRQGVDIVVHPNNLAVAGDASRTDDTTVAEIDGRPISWAEVRDRVVAAGKGAVAANPLASENDARVAAVEREIDLRLMTQKAKASGLDQDSVYQARVREYLKSRLVNLHRKRLIDSWEPSDKELKAYYEANKARFVQPETRKVQMLLVKTQEEAKRLKRAIEDGETTMYQAAQQHSIAANAKHDLGEVGWINRGETVPALDEVIFGVGPGEIGGPVETPGGWQLVKVQDMQETKFDDFSDATTRKLARREYLNDKLDAYAVDLRQKGDFSVEVDQDALVGLAQAEADAVAQLAEEAQQPGSVTEQRVKKLGKLLDRSE